MTIQAQILRLLLTLQRELGMALILVTHDLGVVYQTVDRVAVMYAGEVVELATTAELFARPRHPYTIGLIQSIPSVERRGRLVPIPGSPPDLVEPRPRVSRSPRAARGWRTSASPATCRSSPWGRITGAGASGSTGWPRRDGGERPWTRTASGRRSSRCAAW